MIGEVINYAKKAKEAYINYISTSTYDYNLCKEISNYISNIENLTKEESEKLTTFINANTVKIKHLADIYIPQDEKYSIRRKFKRMIPMKLAKPSSRIYQAKGNFTGLISNNNHHIKIRKKIKYKPKPVS